MTRPLLKLRLASERTGNRRIVITPEPFGAGYDVQVLPPCDGVGHDRECRTAIQARTYATTLSAAMGWPVVDRLAD